MHKWCLLYVRWLITNSSYGPWFTYEKTTIKFKTDQLWANLANYGAQPFAGMSPRWRGQQNRVRPSDPDSCCLRKRPWASPMRACSVRPEGQWELLWQSNFLLTVDFAKPKRNGGPSWRSLLFFVDKLRPSTGASWFPSRSPPIGACGAPTPSLLTPEVDAATGFVCFFVLSWFIYRYIDR